MRRFVLAVTSAALLTVSLTGAALAAKPRLDCPAAQSNLLLVDKDQWWDRTVAGFVTEGITVYEADGVTFTQEFDDFAAAVGFGDGAGLEFFVRETQWAHIDKNDNGLLCMKDRPHTPGNPAFFFTGSDDQASTKKA